MPIPTRELLIALHAAPEMGRRDLYRLASALAARRDGSAAEDASAAGRETLRALEKLGCLGGGDLEAELARRSARAEETAFRLGARLIVFGEADYPSGLADLDEPPPVLAVRGRLPPPPAVAIVGSRRSDPYGIEVAGLFAGSLASAGVTVVSGFARGVDAAAHRAALAEPAGTTLAVLASGLGVDYPRGHSDLAEAIAARGALVTEFGCGHRPRAWHFPWRNRIIAALAAATVVIRAGEGSGALHTARLARGLARKVYAVPGRIADPASRGTHGLIRGGEAELVDRPRDLLLALDLMVEPPEPAVLDRHPLGGVRPARGFTGWRRKVLSVVPSVVPLSSEAIAHRLGARVERVLATLLELELGSLVERLPDGLYRRA